MLLIRSSQCVKSLPQRLLLLRVTASEFFWYSLAWNAAAPDQTVSRFMTMDTTRKSHRGSWPIRQRVHSRFWIFFFHSEAITLVILVERCMEHGTPEQVMRVANAIRGHVIVLSIDNFGCRKHSTQLQKQSSTRCWTRFDDHQDGDAIIRGGCSFSDSRFEN
jgi:hypothetical protein